MSAISRTRASLVVAFLAPALVWLTVLQIVYAIGAYGCETGDPRVPLAVLTVAGLVALTMSTMFAAGCLRRIGMRNPGDAHQRFHRSRFLAAGAVVLGGQFAAALIAQLLVVGLAPACP
jgi:hypothetical protein